MSELVILGSAQDGGVPHAGCRCVNCRHARTDHSARRLPASIGILSGNDWAIVDATSGFEQQMHRLWSMRPDSRNHTGERYSAPDVIYLTHAHSGHYIGLWQLDKSVLAARQATVIAPPKTATFLRQNEPWRQMIVDGYIDIQTSPWKKEIQIARNVTAKPIPVPHRSEWPTDTAGLIIAGTGRSVLYVPDIDFWDEWESDVRDIASSVDVAVLDGSFWDAPTSPDVPHPPITETMDRLQPLVDAGTTRIVFTHLNHSNPVLTSGSPERRFVLDRGFEIAAEGMRIQLNGARDD